MSTEKIVLGLDLGVGSIGWALVKRNEDKDTGQILGIGSRIIPTDAELLSNFEKGNSVSKTADRRQSRSMRRQLSRYKARRARLIAVLKLLKWVPDSFEPGDSLPVSEATLAELKDFFGDNYYQPDWVVYYLRKKALTKEITKEELARILYHFNQRRGFKSSRKTDPILVDENDEPENSSKKKDQKEILIASIIDVADTGEKFKGNSIFELTLADGSKGTIIRKSVPEWKGTEVELERKIKTTKKGEVVSFSIPDKTNWVKQKETLEKNIAKSEKHISEYYLDQFKKNPNYKIKDNIVERKRYVDELECIWTKQIELIKDLDDKTLYPEIIKTLYKNNLTRQKELEKQDLKYILLKDIIYYQRPLKSSRHLIGGCEFESISIKNKAGEIVKTVAQKVAPISHPVAQQFRIWQTIHNLRVSKKNDVKNIDESAQYLTNESKAKLFDLFDQKESVSTASILSALNLSTTAYSLNFQDDSLLGNKTKALIRKAFKRAACVEIGEEILADEQTCEDLWHILYSLEEVDDIAKTLVKRYAKHGLNEKQAAVIAQIPPFKNDFTSYSTKAMRKMLTLMRTGHHFDESRIDDKTKVRLEDISTGVFNENLDDKTREHFIGKNVISHFQGLDKSMACYAIYGRISDQEKDTTPYTSPDDLKPLKLHALRNSLVEQLVNETLKLVRSIWKDLGIRPNAIHIELARDLKKNAKERKEISERNTFNREENKRIVSILKELNNANPYSIADIERLKLWEEAGDETAKANPIVFKSKAEPTKAEIEKYKLWGEQNHICPYTGKVIPLSQLFDKNLFQIDHIIPRSRFFDDSFSNKVVCDGAANLKKNNRTAFEFMQEDCSKEDLELYIKRVNALFKGKKNKYLLMEKPPEDFLSRQLNNTRYISKKVNELLQRVPFAIDEDKRSLFPTSGEITHELRHRWGLGEKMKQLVRHRFERLQKIVPNETNLIVEETNADGQRLLRLKGYDKRIDHRHHALDALIIACTTQAHIQYYNTLNAQNEDQKEKDKYKNFALERRNIKLPWPSFNTDAVDALSKMVVSFKSGKNVLQKAKNKYTKIERDENSFKKVTAIQEGIWSLRAPLHKETRFGEIKQIEYSKVSIKDALKKPEHIADKKLKAIIKKQLELFNNDLKRVEKELKGLQLKDGSIFPPKLELRNYAPVAVNRVWLNETFDAKKIEGKIPDKGLQRVLLSHLKKYDSPKDAFTGEGLEALNKERPNPIKKVRVIEDIGAKFNIGREYPVYVEAAKGTNLFFLIYENIKTGERIIDANSSLALNDIIKLIKANLPIAESKPDCKWITLSPHDLVYMPDENENTNTIDWNNISSEQQAKIYKMVSCGATSCYFIAHSIAKVIIDKVEYESGNKSERANDGRMIKNHCIKLTVDRLGKIKPAPWNI
jgi:CRISPR-associated endonuclease Csn1